MIRLKQKLDLTPPIASPTIDRRPADVGARARLVVLVEKRLAQKSRVEADSEVELLPIALSLDGLRDIFKSCLKTVSVNNKESVLSNTISQHNELGVKICLYRMNSTHLPFQDGNG